MFRFPFALLCALLVITTIDYAVARKSFGGGRHSYPKSTGHSGGGSHSYPKSPGLSGGGSHSYPSQGGLSGGSHNYPSSGGGGSHGYPSSGGLSGHGSGGLSGGGSSYPSNTHHSGSHGYPASTGLSGNKPAGGVTNVHHHYHYNPPQQISYASRVGAAPVSYPVYHGTPPTYVYQYRDSGSKYGTLLTGLALLNLGTLAGTAYAHSHSNSNSNYRSQPGELCKFGVKKENGDYEETKIDCQLMSSFIFQEQAKPQSAVTGVNTTVITSVTNVTTINAGTNEAPAPAVLVAASDVTGNLSMSANGTLVPANSTANLTATDTRSDATSDNNTVTSSVIMTQINTTTVTNALDVKGKAIDVTPVIISVCWVSGAGVGLLPLFGWHAAVDSAPSCYFVEVMDYNYLLFLYFATIVTPSAILAAFYAHIYRVVVKQMSEVMTVEGSQGRMASGTMLRVLGAAQKREVKATQNLAIIVFFFIICWIPLYTINAIKAFMPYLDIPNPLTYISIIVSHLNSAINPLLYAYHLKDFRSALKGLILIILGRGVPLPAAYMPPIPVRRTALERCNALRERPKIYVNSPVWLRQREAELAQPGPKSTVCCSVPEAEPFINSIVADGSSGRLTPEVKENDGSPYLIDGQDRLQSPYKKVEDLFRRVRSISADHS